MIKVSQNMVYFTRGSLSLEELKGRADRPVSWYLGTNHLPGPLQAQRLRRSLSTPIDRDIIEQPGANHLALKEIQLDQIDIILVDYRAAGWLAYPYSMGKDKRAISISSRSAKDGTR